jgi:excisionase family DNA binding protein
VAKSNKDFLTPNEVANLLMVSPVTVRQWAQKGMLHAQTTAGGHRRFTMDSVRQFASERGIELSNVTERLLIVDDNRQLNDLLVALFTTEFPGLDVLTAYDGFEAGRLVQQFKPTVVLLDVMMPGIDGLQVCRSLKSDPQTRGIRVVAMTGYHTPELEKKMLAAGAQVLLSKPFPNKTVIRECGFSEAATARSGAHSATQSDVE